MEVNCGMAIFTGFKNDKKRAAFAASRSLIESRNRFPFPVLQR